MGSLYLGVSSLGSGEDLLSVRKRILAPIIFFVCTALFCGCVPKNFFLDSPTPSHRASRGAGLVSKTNPIVTKGNKLAPNVYFFLICNTYCYFFSIPFSEFFRRGEKSGLIELNCVCSIFFIVIIMEVNRLLADELSNEIYIRGGKVDGTVDEKRQRLRALLRLEQLGSLPTFQLIALNSDEELRICETKILELNEAVVVFDQQNAKNDYSRIQSRILHVEGRLKRILEEDKKEAQRRLLARCVELTEELEKNMADITDQPIENLGRETETQDEAESSTIPAVNLVEPQLLRNTSQIESPEMQAVQGNSTTCFEQRIRQINFEHQNSPTSQYGTEDAVLNRHRNTAARSSEIDSHLVADASRSFVTVSKWNLHFNGTSSVTNFIERAEELRIACGISKTHLLNCAVTLFEGTALSWFRAVRNSIHSWDDLVRQLRLTYLSAEYDEDIWNDLRNRTQGEGEKTAVFIAIMENLFNKLSRKPDELSRLRIIRRNMLPFFQNQLALHPINSLGELISACRHMEDVLLRTQRIRPPPTNPNYVTEPDLMFRRTKHSYSSLVNSQQPEDLIALVDESNTSAIQVVQPTTSANPRYQSSSLLCWNCRKTGHLKRNCTQPLTKHCFKCGRPNETTRTCPTCAGKGFPSH